MRKATNTSKSSARKLTYCDRGASHKARPPSQSNLGFGFEGYGFGPWRSTAHIGHHFAIPKRSTESGQYTGQTKPRNPVCPCAPTATVLSAETAMSSEFRELSTKSCVDQLLEFQDLRRK